MTPPQCRAARGLLKWNQDDLAHAARVSVVTVRNFENDKSVPQRATLEVIQRALEAAGVEFFDGDSPGVRLRPGTSKPDALSNAGSTQKAKPTAEPLPRGRPVKNGNT
jgi:transcriptional regulator with XRE-family HTH domain